MTMGEVAEIAGDPKETIRARINRGLARQQKTPGWARIDVPSTVEIAVHAELLRLSVDHEIAFKAANYVRDCMKDAYNFPVLPVKRKGQLKGACLIFRRSGIDPSVWTYTHYLTQDDALYGLGQHYGDTTETLFAGFFFLNVSTLTDWAMDRIFDLQGIDGNEARAPK